MSAQRAENYMNTRALPPGVEVINTDVIPHDNADHAGEHAVQLRTATNAEAWGFGETQDDAVSEALATLAEDL